MNHRPVDRFHYAPFGFLFAAERRGADVHLAGHRWVALAVDKDDPVTVTILHDVVARQGLDRDVALVGQADEVYDVAIDRTPDACRVHFVLHGVEAVFTCRTVTCGTRYLTHAELDGLSRRLSLDGEGMARYRAGIESRRRAVAGDPLMYQVPIPVPI